MSVVQTRQGLRERQTLFDGRITISIRRWSTSDRPRDSRADGRRTSPAIRAGRRPHYFEHDDPALRSLLPVQKQLLLVGPERRRRLMSWLKDLAANLDLKID
jgi:hypothetical protein